ncbi:MAG TPA: Hsp20/alpha crystallin family protein [Pirellulales bacterium]|nr:Hsp20/alpha crystallin family protein [Pirellulales bacterium]
MFEESHRLLRKLMLPKAEECQRALWRPAVDVYRTRQGWLLKFDLAGVRPDEIELLAQGRQVTVRGVRRDTCLEEGRHFYSLEINYNRFERSVELPCSVEQARIATEDREGMLLVQLTTEAEAP